MRSEMRMSCGTGSVADGTTRAAKLVAYTSKKTCPRGYATILFNGCNLLTIS